MLPLTSRPHVVFVVTLCLALGCSRPEGGEVPLPGPPPAAPKPAATPSQPSPSEPIPAKAAATLVPGTPEHYGSELYARMCAVCHGADGEGYKADQATALAQPDFLASASDQLIGSAIAQGRLGTTMSAWHSVAGGPLRDPDIAALVAFIRTWQRGPAVQLDERPTSGDVQRGKAIFTRECERCHGPTAPNVRILAPQFLANASSGFIRHALRTGRPPTSMQSYSASLGEGGIEDVVAYLRSLPTKPAEARAALPPPIPLGPVPNPKGPEPQGFQAYPAMTKVDVVGAQHARKARMLLLDARVPSDYELEHIRGAVSVPFYDPTPYIAQLPKNTWLVCYCGCPHAESGQLAKKLQATGFSKVTVLDEGLWDWKQKGLPMSSGRAP